MPNEEQARDGALHCLTPDPTGGGTESRREPPSINAEVSDEMDANGLYQGVVGPEYKLHPQFKLSVQFVRGYNAGRASRDAEVEELRAELDFAIKEVEAWAGYAAPYFQSKHDLEGSLARLRAALARHAEKGGGG